MPAVHHVRGWRGVPRRGERGAPEQLPCALIESVEGVVVGRRADEEKAVLCHDGAAVVVGARVLDALRGELGIFAEGNLPANGALVEIDCGERSPGRRDARIALVVDEDVEKCIPPRDSVGVGTRGGRRVAAGDEKVYKISEGASLERCPEGGHAAVAFANGLRDLRARAPSSNVHERRRHGTPLPALTVTARAIRGVE